MHIQNTETYYAYVLHIHKKKVLYFYVYSTDNKVLHRVLKH